MNDTGCYLNVVVMDGTGCYLNVEAMDGTGCYLAVEATDDIYCDWENQMFYFETRYNYFDHYRTAHYILSDNFASFVALSYAQNYSEID